jgi:hypothetical protein
VLKNIYQLQEKTVEQKAAEEVRWSAKTFQNAKIDKEQ